MLHIVSESIARTTTSPVVSVLEVLDEGVPVFLMDIFPPIRMISYPVDPGINELFVGGLDFFPLEVPRKAKLQLAIFIPERSNLVHTGIAQAVEADGLLDNNAQNQVRSVVSPGGK